jgi:Uma2 family endonuclease
VVANAQKKWTVEEYLAFERASEEKHEYHDGVVFPVGNPPPPSTHGVGRRHSVIVTNTIRCLGNQLFNTRAEIYTGDMRIKTRADKFRNSDIVLVHDQPEFANEEQDLLLNPTLIVDVLSPSTEQDDRGKKFTDYRMIASLQEFLLIAQDEISVEHYVRQLNNDWLFSTFKIRDAVVDLPSINCTLRLADVYNKITFETDDTTDV